MATKGDSVPAVSIIVPVCNVERYVGECLEGLHNQTLEDVEILLVDDGSTDDCPRILAQAAARDPRMRVITKPNGGYGSGINAGLAQATGRYIGIVEPDDVVDVHMYEDLFAAARLSDGGWADVVKSSYWEYYDVPGREPYIKAPNLMNCMPKHSFCSTVAEEFEVLFHHPSVWSCIYRRDFLVQHDIAMMEVPGGGWVDNPFFFQTLLQAERFVWVPAAYYYYRQTNPNSSSNLKDYHLPFDRLRDLRALFQQMNVTDPQLIACLYARHFFYTASVVGEWGFSEKDPELAALIREEMEALDPDIVYGKYRGIRTDYQAFYESIVGDPVAGVKERGEAAVPRVSVVVPMHNDREVIVPTLRDLAAQTLDEIEVVCVDCASEDLTPDLVAAFAQKDARFSLVRVEEGNRAAGTEAGLALVHAPACAIVFPGQAVPKKHLEQSVEALGEGVDMAIAVRGRARSYGLLKGKETAGVFPAQGVRAELTLCAVEDLAGCAFRTAFLAEADLHARPADDNGSVFVFEAVSAADKVALRSGAAPSGRAARRSFTKSSRKTSLEHYEERRGVCEELTRLAAGRDEDVQRAARCLVARRMLNDVRRFVCVDDAEEIFADLQEAFRGRYGLLDAPRTSYCNQDVFANLELSLSASYTHLLKNEASFGGSARAVAASKGRSSRQVAAVKESWSYRIGNAIVRTGRKLLPTTWYRALKSRH